MPKSVLNKKRIEEAKKAGQAKKEEEAKEAERQDTTSDEAGSAEESEAAKDAVKKKPVLKQTTKTQKRSGNYQSVVTLVDRKKIYPVKEALDLLPKLKRAKFDETVELHINTTENGISGNFVLPHGTGKKTRVAIANDDVIAQVEKGVIDFDILIAEPSMMPKLARVAKFLGPRGLMPNPKNGTISPKPQEVAKKYEGGQVNFKTESKFPLLHLSVGKVSFGGDKLAENIKVALQSVQVKNIRSATLKSTMSPGIKIDTTSI